MGQVRFSVGTRFKLDGELFIIDEQLLGNRFKCTSLRFGTTKLFEQAELLGYWAAHRLFFEIFGPNTHKTEQDISTEFAVTTLDGLPKKYDKYKEEVQRRYDLIKPLLAKLKDLGLEFLPRKHIVEYAETLSPRPKESISKTQTQRTARKRRGKTGNANSAKTIERYLNSFLESGYDLRSLIPGFVVRVDKGINGLPEDEENVIQGVLDTCIKHRSWRTVNGVYLMVVDAVKTENARRALIKVPLVNLPSESTVKRRIEQRGSDLILRPRSSYNRNKANEPSDTPSERLTRILQRVEIDLSTLPLLVVDEEDRFPIANPTYAIGEDCYSRYPWGLDLSFEPEGFLPIMCVAQHGILPKPDCQALYGTQNPFLSFGIPEYVATDRSSGFAGNDWNNACLHIGMGKALMIARKAWFRGRIERKIRSTKGLIYTLPSATLSNILARKDFISDEIECISLSALNEVVHAYLLDEYCAKWQKRAGGVPRRLWEESAELFPPALFHSAEDVRWLLCKTYNRLLRRTGIEFETLIYFNNALGDLYKALPTGQPIQIKVDPRNIENIGVRDPRSGKIIEVPAIGQDYARGTSLYKHRISRRYVLHRMKVEVDIYSLAEARVHIQEVAERELRKTKGKRSNLSAFRLSDRNNSPKDKSDQPTNSPAQPAPIPEPDHEDDQSRDLDISTLPPPNLDGWSADYGDIDHPSDREDDKTDS